MDTISKKITKKSWEKLGTETGFWGGKNIDNKLKLEISTDEKMGTEERRKSRRKKWKITATECVFFFVLQFGGEKIRAKKPVQSSVENIIFNIDAGIITNPYLLLLLYEK